MNDHFERQTDENFRFPIFVSQDTRFPFSLSFVIKDRKRKLGD